MLWLRVVGEASVRVCNHYRAGCRASAVRLASHLLCPLSVRALGPRRRAALLLGAARRAPRAPPRMPADLLGPSSRGPPRLGPAREPRGGGWPGRRCALRRDRRARASSAAPRGARGLPAACYLLRALLAAGCCCCSLLAAGLWLVGSGPGAYLRRGACTVLLDVHSRARPASWLAMRCAGQLILCNTATMSSLKRTSNKGHRRARACAGGPKARRCCILLCAGCVGVWAGGSGGARWREAPTAETCQHTCAWY